MSHIPENLKDSVRVRADNRCEYCGLSQVGQEATFHIDHIVPKAAGGETDEANLALACVGCSLHKAARLEAVDPDSGQIVRLYHPRQDRWQDHFEWNDVILQGISAVGQATIAALQMNRPTLIAIRVEERYLGRHPRLR